MQVSITLQGTYTMNAQEYLQTIPNDIVAAAARGEIDLNRLAQIELASRGLDMNGKWVGFPRARELHSVTNS